MEIDADIIYCTESRLSPQSVTPTKYVPVCAEEYQHDGAARYRVNHSLTELPHCIHEQYKYVTEQSCSHSLMT